MYMTNTWLSTLSQKLETVALKSDWLLKISKQFLWKVLSSRLPFFPVCLKYKQNYKKLNRNKMLIRILNQIIFTFGIFASLFHCRNTRSTSKFNCIKIKKSLKTVNNNTIFAFPIKTTFDIGFSILVPIEYQCQQTENEIKTRNLLHLRIRA